MRSLRRSSLGLMFSIALAIMAPAERSPAADGDAGWAGAALRLGLGARAQGMGGAYVSLAHGASAVYWNPAALPLERSREVTFAYSHLPWDRNLAYAGLKVPVEPAAGLGLAWIHAGVGDIQGRDHNGQITEELTSAENAFCLAFGVRLSPYLQVGLGMKYLYYKLADISATGFGFDLGLRSSPVDGLNLGLAVADLNAKYTWNTEEVWDPGTTTYDQFPVNIRCGASYCFLQERLTVAADVAKNEEQAAEVHLGVEFSAHPTLMVRAGLDEDRPTFGASLSKPISSTQVQLDYALSFDSVTSEATHIFGWGFKF